MRGEDHRIDFTVMFFFFFCPYSRFTAERTFRAGETLRYLRTILRGVNIFPNKFQILRYTHVT